MNYFKTDNDRVHQADDCFSTNFKGLYIYYQSIRSFDISMFH